jgi:hypothetical protein
MTQTSRISGITVGQPSRTVGQSFGISSSVMPRRPRRLASKCTCTKTPQKCIAAGTAAAISSVVSGISRNSIMTKAAAPMIGGVICPPALAAASTAPAKCGL